MKSCTIPLMPFQYSQDRAILAKFTQKALAGMPSKQKRAGLNQTLRGVTFIAACFEALWEQDSRNRIIFIINDGFTCEVKLPAWAYERQAALKLHLAFSGYEFRF